METRVAGPPESTRAVAPWYGAGLRFSCTQCGACCSGTTGYVWVGADEIRAMAALLGMPLDDFGRRYLRRVGSRYALLESEATGDCTFLRDRRCTIYDARPRQCRSFPFWRRNLATRQTWAEAAEHCEGISADAALVSLSEIEHGAKLSRGDGGDPPS